MDGIGINGMGRIGRLLLRKALSEGNLIGIKAINIIHPLETIAHLLKYDSTHGIWDATIDSQPLVSTDFIGSTKSAVIDGLSLMVSQNQIKVLAWYDNEWAYTCRVMDLAQKVKEMKMERMRIIC